MTGEHTYSEITSQPEAWSATVASFANLEPKLQAAWWGELRPAQIVVTGCGSTYYLAQTAARLLQAATARPVQAVPASELVFHVDDIVPDPPNALLLAVSRSGTTTETLEAVRRFKSRRGGAVWAVTCYPDSALAQRADLVFPTDAAQEESVAQTRSFTSMLVMCQTIAAALSRTLWNDMGVLADHARFLLRDTQPLMAQLAADWPYERVYFLASGAQYGIASEAMLKMTEMSLTPSQAFHFMEFRHGPMSMAGPETLIVGLLSHAGYPHEGQVLQEMTNLGAATLALNPTGYEIPATWTITMPDSLLPNALPALYLPPLQLLAYFRAREKGLDPDNPRNLTAVIELDTAALAETPGD